MTDYETLILWVGATRYHLGRMTYAVQDMCEMLRHNWTTLPPEVQKIIRHDVEERFTVDDEMRALGRNEGLPRLPLGMDCDRAEWEMVRKLWEAK